MIYEAIGGIVLVAALLTFGLYAFYRAGREAGYEEGRADRAQAQLAERRAQRREPGRHARTQPRQQPPWHTGTPGPAALPSGGAIAVMVARWQAAKPAVTPPRVDTVLLTPEAAPDKTGAPDTGTMPRVTDTGEIAAITDQFIADLELREAAHRKELTEAQS